MPEPTIPIELRQRLDALRPVLTANGVVQLHHGQGRRPLYRLRYRHAAAAGETRRHRSLALGGCDVADAVRRLIETWRDEQRALAVEQRRRDDEARLQHRHLRAERRATQEAGGGGARRRRAIGREFDRAAPLRLARGTLRRWRERLGLLGPTWPIPVARSPTSSEWRSFMVGNRRESIIGLKPSPGQADVSDPPPGWWQIAATNAAGFFLIWLGGGPGFWANLAFWPGLFVLLSGVMSGFRRHRLERDQRVLAGLAPSPSPLASGIALMLLPDEY